MARRDRPRSSRAIAPVSRAIGRCPKPLSKAGHRVLRITDAAIELARRRYRDDSVTRKRHGACARWQHTHRCNRQDEGTPCHQDSGVRAGARGRLRCFSSSRAATHCSATSSTVRRRCPTSKAAAQASTVTRSLAFTRMGATRRSPTSPNRKVRAFAPPAANS